MDRWGLGQRLLLLGSLVALLGGSGSAPATTPPVSVQRTLHTVAYTPPAPQAAAAGGTLNQASQNDPAAAQLPTQASMPSGLNVITSTTFYTIVGTTAAELATQINTLGPIEGERHFAANTSWLISWSYRYQLRDGMCVIASSTVEVELTFIYPRWTPPPRVAPELIARWDNFLAAVELHEQGHVDIAMQAGSAVLRAVNTAAPSRSCSELGAAVNAQSDSILDFYNREQRRYDDDTRHGSTQGASF